MRQCVFIRSFPEHPANIIWIEERKCIDIYILSVGLLCVKYISINLSTENSDYRIAYRYHHRKITPEATTVTAQYQNHALEYHIIYNCDFLFFQSYKFIYDRKYISINVEKNKMYMFVI